jgi:hypothetical protein
MRAGFSQLGLSKKTLALGASRAAGGLFFELGCPFRQTFFEGTDLLNPAAPLSHGALLELLKTTQKPQTHAPVPKLKPK